jgi:hypothetical protein
MNIEKVLPRWMVNNIKERFPHITNIEQIKELTDEQLLSVSMFGKMRLQRLRNLDDTHRIPTRQFCAICGHIHKIDFHVPDHIWKLAIHTNWRNSIVCLNCFMERADEKLLPWDDTIELRPTSFYTRLKLRG